MTDSDNKQEATVTPEAHETSDVSQEPAATEEVAETTGVSEEPTATEESTVTEEVAETPDVSEEPTVTEETPEASEVSSTSDAPTVSEESVETEDVSPAEKAPTQDETTSDPEMNVEGEELHTRAGMNWFVLRVASNKEDYVKAALDRKVEIEAMQHLVGRIMVPTEKTKTLSKTGKAKITETKLYPGYIFVEMKLEEQRISQDVFFLIKETTGVGDFVGTAGKPTPMSLDEVDKMLFDSKAPDQITEVKLEFAVGDHVNIKEGPFMGYEGTVDEIFPEKGIVRVIATVFGRQTQIEIEYWMIEKAG